MPETDATNNRILAANKLLSDYFGRFVFHDCAVLHIEYDPPLAMLSVAISLDLFRAYLPGKSEASLVFGRVLNVVFNNHPSNLVAESHIESVDWQHHLKPKHSRKHFNFLYCTFAESEYKDFSTTRMKKGALEATLTFDNWIKITVDFLDFKVALPKHLTKQQLLRVARKYWSE